MKSHDRITTTAFSVISKLLSKVLSWGCVGPISPVMSQKMTSPVMGKFVKKKCTT